jgi:hypothetical protein
MNAGIVPNLSNLNIGSGYEFSKGLCVYHMQGYLLN